MVPPPIPLALHPSYNPARTPPPPSRSNAAVSSGSSVKPLGGHDGDGGRRAVGLPEGATRGSARRLIAGRVADAHGSGGREHGTSIGRCSAGGSRQGHVDVSPGRTVSILRLCALLIYIL